MLSLKRKDGPCPPDLYQYRFPEDRFLVTAYDYDSWIAQIKKHAVDNEYPIPSNEECENQLCRRLSGEWCIGGGPHSFVNTRFTLNDFIRGTKVLASFALSGNVVSKEVSESRALICSRCPINVRVPGCASCSQMANVVGDVKGAQTTKYDNLLEACGICHCSNQAAVWIPAEYLAKGVTPEMMQTYKEIDEVDGCWKYRELIDLAANQA